MDEGGGNLEECVGRINAPVTVHDSLIIVVFHVGSGSRDAAKAGLIADAAAGLQQKPFPALISLAFTTRVGVSFSAHRASTILAEQMSTLPSLWPEHDGMGDDDGEMGIPVASNF